MLMHFYISQSKSSFVLNTVQIKQSQLGKETNPPPPPPPTKQKKKKKKTSPVLLH